MNGRGKSDGRIVPQKQPNNGGPQRPPAEAVEGSRPTKGNTQQSAVPRTQSRTRTSIGLMGVREANKSLYAKHPR